MAKLVESNRDRRKEDVTKIREVRPSSTDFIIVGRLSNGVGFHAAAAVNPFMSFRPILIVRKTENENQPKGLPCIRHRWFSKKGKFVTLSNGKPKPINAIQHTFFNA